MKHLLPYLQDDQKAADYLRQVRWPDGVTCPRCGSDAVEPRERCDNGLQRFNCAPCATRLGQQFAMCTDWTHSIFEESKLGPVEWLLVMHLFYQFTQPSVAVSPCSGNPLDFFGSFSVRLLQEQGPQNATRGDRDIALQKMFRAPLRRDRTQRFTVTSHQGGDGLWRLGEVPQCFVHCHL